MQFASVVVVVRFNLFFVIFENLLVFLVLLDYCGKVKVTNGAIIVISKRAEAESERSCGLKPFCKISDGMLLGEDEKPSKPTSFLKMDCDRVPGPLRRLDLEMDGYFRLDREHFVAPSEYCVMPGNSNFGKLCPTHSDPLWRKCCGENELLDKATLKCRRSHLKYRPKVKGSSVLQSFIVVKNKTGTGNEVGLACGIDFMPRVYSSLSCLPGSSGSFQLASNGTPMYQVRRGVFLRKSQLKAVDDLEGYCLDGMVDFTAGFGVDCGNEERSESEYEPDPKCQREVGEVLLVCGEEQETFLNEDGNEKGVPKAYFFAALWLSTCPLLVSAAVANSCVIQRNVHGWILTSYLLSMFLVNINSVVLILDIAPSPTTTTSTNSPSMEEMAGGGCGLLDFTMKFIYMSSLCWMTAMNFGLWRTFSSTVPQVMEPRRFLLSAVFSLGFPVVSVAVSYHMGSQPEHPADDVHGGNVTSTPSCRSRGGCPLYSYNTLPYYSGPIILLVICNVVAFLKTSTTIASLRRQAEAVLHKQTKDHLESFTLFAKLFLLTGSIWVIRVVLLVLQIQGLYVTWYGVALEAVFSIPEVVFPMIIFGHPEFIKWAGSKSPIVSRMLVKCNPLCGKEERNFELRSGNQMSSMAQHQQQLVRHSSSSQQHRQSQSQSQDGNSPRSGTGTTTGSGESITVTTFTREMAPGYNLDGEA